jgi:hypothetical protein
MNSEAAAKLDVWAAEEKAESRSRTPRADQAVQKQVVANAVLRVVIG